MKLFFIKLFGLCPGTSNAMHDWNAGEVIGYSNRSMTELYKCSKCGKTKQVQYGSRTS